MAQLQISARKTETLPIAIIGREDEQGTLKTCWHVGCAKIIRANGLRDYVLSNSKITIACIVVSVAPHTRQCLGGKDIMIHVVNGCQMMYMEAEEQLADALNEGVS